MFFAVVYALLIVGLPVLWLWVWRGRFLSRNFAGLPKNPAGMRLEVHREQTLRAIKNMLPIWLTMVLAEASTLVHIMPVSRDHRLMWVGFLIASSLFIIGWNLVNLAALIRQQQEKRRQKQQTSS